MRMAVCEAAQTPAWRDVDDLSMLSEYRDEQGELLWAQEDVANVDDRMIDVIAEEFELSPFAVEDAKSLRQRPKLESYERHLFLVVYQLDEERDQLEARQVSCFVGDGYVLNIHEGAERTLNEALRRWSELPRNARASRTRVVHTLLDAVVDDYRDIADHLETEIEELEERVLTTPSAGVEKELYAVKQSVARLRRFVLPMTRVLDWILDGAGKDMVPRESVEMFRDVNDHLLRILDQVRNIDDLASAVFDFRRSEQTARLNDTILKLTGWAAIIAVPTWIASVYGMNFDLVPPDGSSAGFWFAIALMAVSAVSLYYYFKRKNWV